jgi:hypothetical protein
MTRTRTHNGTSEESNKIKQVGKESEKDGGEKE